MLGVAVCLLTALSAVQLESASKHRDTQIQQLISEFQQQQQGGRVSSYTIQAVTTK